MAYAPQPILQLFAVIQHRIPQAQLGGVTGDVRHSFGYHLARNELPGDDYSVVLPPDRQGDGGAASALDVTLPPDLMLTCTRRLLAAAKGRDPRLKALREFCGTTDGNNTHPYDLSNGQDGPLNSWDSSHLWHIHLSFYRQFAGNAAALAPIADVITGTNAPSSTPAPFTSEEDDMPYTVYRIADGTPNAGHCYAVRPGSAPFWMSGDDYHALNRFGLLTNPAQKDWKAILQAELDQLTTAIGKGNLR